MIQLFRKLPSLWLLSIIMASAVAKGQAPTKIDLSRALYLNQSLVGRPEATREHGQDTLNNFNACGAWYNQPEDSVYCYNMHNNYLTGGGGSRIPYPLEFTIDTKAHAEYTRIAIYIGNRIEAPSGTHLRVMTGIPFQWQDTIITITDDGAAITNKWLKFSIPALGNNQFLHVELDGPFPELEEIVAVGKVAGLVPLDGDPLPVPVDNKKMFGVNGIFGMGLGDDSVHRINHMKSFSGARIYEWLNFSVENQTAPETLINNGQGINFNSSQLSDTLIGNGTNVFITFSETTLPSQWKPWIPKTVNLAQQKAIDWELGIGSDTTAQGFSYFNKDRISEKASSYNHVAWFLKKMSYALGTRTLPYKWIEPGNEFDGAFLPPAKRYSPNELAAYCSAVYDGHENTLTYNGESVGVKNSGTDMKMVMPALNIYNMNFLRCMEFWFYWNRSDHKFAADFINDHSYPNTTGIQGGNGVGVMPEDAKFNLQGKMRALKKFGDKIGLPTLNTEIGYDNYDSLSTSPYCPTGVGNPNQFHGSFMNTPSVPGQSIIQTNGNMIARTMLTMRSADVPYFNYWLADQFNHASSAVCGTFNSSGLLALDTQINFIPYYVKRPAWYYFLTVDTLLKGMDFISDNLMISGNDSVRIQQYRNTLHPDSILYAVWSPTVKNAAFNYTLPFATAGFARQINLAIGSEIGSAGSLSGLLNNINLNITETPVFVALKLGAVLTANAGNDVSITLPVTSSALNGVGTAGINAVIAGYQWTKISGPAVGTIVNAGIAQTTAIALVPGVYEFELTVTDNNNAFAKDTMQITVNASNQPPVANAGNDGTITLPINTAALNGSGTDVDGTVTAYQWTKISGPSAGTIAAANAAQTTTNGLVQGIYQFEFKVTDNNGATGRDTMQITVNAAANQPPIANAGPDVMITVFVNSAALNGSGTDPDGTVTNYLWKKISGPTAGTIASPTSAQTTASGLVQGTYIFELTVTDNNGATGKDSMQVTVNAAIPINQLPLANAGPDVTITLPTNTASLNGSGTDADGTISSYQWTKISGPVAGSVTTATSMQTTANSLVQGIYKFELTVTDNNGATGKDTMQVTVNAAAPVNQPPVANAGTDISITLPVNTVSLTGSGTDADGTIVSYLWTKISGPATGIIANANSAQTVVTSLVQGIYKYELTVTDNNGGIGKDTVQVTVNGLIIINQAPIAIAGNNTTIQLPVNTTALNGSGTDADGTVVSFLWTKIAGPALANISSPNSAQTLVGGLIQGTYKFELRVTDNQGAIGKDTVQVIVNAIITQITVNKPPKANAGADISIVLPTNSTVLLGTGTDVDGTVVGYKWRIISGTGQPALQSPQSAQSLLSNLEQGIYHIELTVTDNSGATGKDTLLVAVGSPRLAPGAVNEVRLYPNPAERIVNVEIASFINNQTANLKIFEVTGVLVIQKNVILNQSLQTEKVDVGNFKAGTYLIKITYEDNTVITKKLIKL